LFFFNKFTWVKFNVKLIFVVLRFGWLLALLCLVNAIAESYGVELAALEIGVAFLVFVAAAPAVSS
jgi:hypothetical protein